MNVNRKELSSYLSWSPFPNASLLQIKQNRQVVEPEPQAEFNPENLHLPTPFANRPLLAPLLQRWLRQLDGEKLATKTFVSRSNGQLQDAPENITTLANHLATFLDIQRFQVKVGLPEIYQYAELGKTESQTQKNPSSFKLVPESVDLMMIVSPGLLELPKITQRFLLLRALHAHYQRHNHLWSITQNFSPEMRKKLFNNFYHWNQRNAVPILAADWQPDQPNLARSSHWLTLLCNKYRSQALIDLRDLMLRSQPYKLEFDVAQTRFALSSNTQINLSELLPLLMNESDVKQLLESLDYHP
jgi:hypothetical protein